LWLTLPEHWRSQTFVAAAARRGIALTPSSAFAVGPGHAPNAIRLALAAPPLEQLQEALQTLARLLGAREEEFDYTE
jgi:DNA-binding transcriptional MocR family regulator